MRSGFFKGSSVGTKSSIPPTVKTSIFLTPLHVITLTLQCSQKVSFRPETGPEFPQNEKYPKLFGPMYFYRIWPAFIGKKYFAYFGGETYFFWPLYMFMVIPCLPAKGRHAFIVHGIELLVPRLTTTLAFIQDTFATLNYVFTSLNYTTWETDILTEKM